MSWACFRCQGRGWLRASKTDSFPEPCDVCGGSQQLGPAQVAQLLAPRSKKKRATMRHYLWQVETQRASAAVALRVFRAIDRRLPEVLHGATP